MRSTPSAPPVRRPRRRPVPAPPLQPKRRSRPPARSSRPGRSRSGARAAVSRRMRPGPDAANGPSVATVGVDQGELYTGVGWSPLASPVCDAGFLQCLVSASGLGSWRGWASWVPDSWPPLTRGAPRDARRSKDVSKTEGINAPADPTPHRKWRADLHRQNRSSRSGGRSPPFWTSWPKFLSPGLDGSGARRMLRNCRSSHAQARRFRGARAGYHGAVSHHCRGVLICRICRSDTASPSPPLCCGAFRDRCWRSGLPRRDLRNQE